MKQYIDILKDLYIYGVPTPLARDKMPATQVLPDRHMTFDVTKGIPLLTTKKVYVRGAIAEILWILRGEQNIKSLLDVNCNVWNPNAYKYYKEKVATSATLEPVSMDDFIDAIKNGNDFICRDKRVHDCLIYRVKGEKAVRFSKELHTVDHEILLNSANQVKYLMQSHNYVIGDMGRIYGPQWRSWMCNKYIGNSKDQIAELIDGLKREPYSRYHLVRAWNPAEMPGPDCGQPNCHGDFDITCMPDQIASSGVRFNLSMRQRSADYMLGVPFNLLHYYVVGLVIEKLTGYRFAFFHWHGVNVHLYQNQVESALKQIKREPLPVRHFLRLDAELETINDIMNLSPDDFVVVNSDGIEKYHNLGEIKAPLSVGL